MQGKPKYELVTGDAVAVPSGTAIRVRALRPIPTHGVRTGDLGGYVQSSDNLSQTGEAWIADEAMAVGRSRVEDDALASDHSILTDYAILRDRARMSRWARASDHATIRDMAHLTDMAHATDTVTLSGTTLVDHGYGLTGDTVYGSPADAPISLRLADPSSAALPGLLDEAVGIDPTIGRAFAVLGAASPADRAEALASLRDQPEGRAALTAIVSAAGGTFHPNTYLAVDGRVMAAQSAASVLRLSFDWSLHGVRSFVAIGVKPIRDPVSGEACFTGVLKTVHRSDTPAFYQAAIFRDQTPELALTPLPVTITILPGTHATFLDAEAAANTKLADLGDTMPPSANHHPAQRPPRDIETLPILLQTERRADLRRFILTTAEANASMVRSLFMELHADADFGTALDFQALVRDPLKQWRASRLSAAQNPHRLILSLPVPHRQLADAIGRAKTDTPTEGQDIMKRDMDLVRSILMEIEENQQINGHFVLSDADIVGKLDADRGAVQYHLRLLLDAGYIEGKDLLADMEPNGTSDVRNIMRDSGSSITVSRLTWDGHEFTDSVRDTHVWSKTKGYLKDVGGVGIDVLKDVAKAVVKEQITNHTGLTFNY